MTGVSLDIDKIVKPYADAKKAYSGFMYNVIDFFGADNSDLTINGSYVVHSLKHRIKEPSHLAEKIHRKISSGKEINSENILDVINDFCGVRVLHLRLGDFEIIHKAIIKHIQGEHWVLAEAPKAYTWDPEYKVFFEEIGIKTEIKPSFYTSVHYVVKPNAQTKVSCEIQVRTLFEEVWGEIDHDLNYPNPSQSIAQKEQLKVLAKLVGAGTKLVDSIYKSE